MVPASSHLYLFLLSLEAPLKAQFVIKGKFDIENGKAHQGSSDHICWIVHAQIDSGCHNSHNKEQEQTLYQALDFLVLNPLLDNDNQGPKNNGCGHGMSARERVTTLFDQMRKTGPASLVKEFNQLNQNPM